jgi:hypothetical protein
MRAIVNFRNIDCGQFCYSVKIPTSADRLRMVEQSQNQRILGLKKRRSGVHGQALDFHEPTLARAGPA